MRRVYLDYASITPIDPLVVREMKKYSEIEYANPSSIYREGVQAKKAIADGRRVISEFIHAHDDEIIFTSGGTEANSLALEGAGRAARRAGIVNPHIIITDIEHSSINETAAMLERHGVEITRLAVGPDGLVDVADLKKFIKPSTFMVSIMTINNEIGTIQPIREIAKAIRHAREHLMPKRADGSRSVYPLFHTDAAQALAHIELNVELLGVDLMTMDAAKAYGPRGVGSLYVRRGVPIEPLIYGGGQERGLRSGTENLPGIMGFAKALDICATTRVKESQRLLELKDMLYKGMRDLIPDVVLSPQPLPINHASLAPHILNVSIPGIDNEFFVLQLDARGFAISTKSSCLRDEDESYVLRAVGADSRTSVRISLGRWTSRGDIRAFIKTVKSILG